MRLRKFKDYFLTEVKEGDKIYIKFMMSEVGVILKGPVVKIDIDGFWMENETNYNSEEFVSYDDLDYYEMKERLEWAFE